MVNQREQRQETVPQYFKLLRYYSVTSLASIVIVAIVLSVLTRHIVESNTIEMAEEKNVSMTQTLVNTLWKKHAAFILSLSERSGEEILAHPQTQQLYNDIEHHMLGLEVLKVKIFDLQGLTLFSTDESQTGSISREQGFQAARTGAIISELTFRDHMDSFEGVIVNRDVVATYIPIRGSPFEPVQGVIELYTDVTDLLIKMRDSVTHSIISVLLVLIVLYFALFYIVRHGEKIIRAQKQKIDFQENFDALTLLPNRQLFKDRLKHGIALARRNNELLAMLFINLDHFKSMNEGFGHDSGDLLLKEAASRLTANLHEYDTVARLGGDEFSLILEGIKDINRVTDICKRLLDVLSAPYIIDGAEVFVTASIGAALYPLNGQDERSILRAADAAISRAKEGGRNGFQFYSEDMATKAFERMSLETSLHRALERNEFEVYYQPKYDIDGETITGAEALLRWHHPEMGTVNPDDFIPVLESSNLIVAVGEWVLRTACCQARTWQSITRRPFTIAVNISVRQFYDVGMIEKIKAILQDTGLPAASLELEITESVLMQDNVTSLDNLLRLHKENIRIAIDDFGTGYSSLSYLKRFPLHTLKIDRAFVRDLAIDQNDMEIIKAIIAMAKSLGLEVVAEGVETHEQLQFLQQQGCDQLQGFLLCKPQPATDLLALIAGSSPDKVIVRFADL